MSKAMVPESIMKLFLMIAVIIVGMSFLMKAFGIDIFGLLEKWFPGFGGGLFEGKGLHLKVDPTNNEVWEFHLISDKNVKKHESEHQKNPMNPLQTVWHTFFLLDSIPADNCILLTNNELEYVNGPDEGYVYYINNGARLQNHCESPTNCLYGMIAKNGCTPTRVDAGKECEASGQNCLDCTNDLEYCTGKVTRIACKGVYNYVNCAGPAIGLSGHANQYGACDTNQVALKMKFGYGNFPKNSPCKDSYSTMCNLIEPDSYSVKNELLCINGKWKACTSQIQGNEFSYNGVRFVCENEQWLADGNLKVSDLPLGTITSLPLSIFTQMPPKEGESVKLDAMLDDYLYGNCFILTGQQGCLIPDSVNYFLPGEHNIQIRAFRNKILVEYISKTIVIDNLATESNNGWKGLLNTKITLDGLDKKIGDNSIKVSVSGKITRNSNSIFARYEFTSPRYLNEKVSFYWKATGIPGTAINLATFGTLMKVYLVDDFNSVVENKDNIVVHEKWPTASLTLNQNDFKLSGKSTSFNWNGIKSIEFVDDSESITTLWVDGLYLK